MDYEKEYKSLVAKVKKAHQFAQTDSTKNVLEDILPQLHESEDERTRRRLIDFISSIKAISESGRNSWAVRKDDAEMCNAFLAYLEKQKENPKSDDSIPSDCTSDAKCEDRWHKTANSLPDTGRDVLAKDALGNYLLASFDGAQWFVSVYDGEDHPVLHTPSILEWCDIPSEKQKYHFRDDTKKVEKQDYSGLNDLERAIHRGFLSAGVENVPVTIIKETANECKRTQTIANENANAEWSEDDEQYLLVCNNALAKYCASEYWSYPIISKWLVERLKFPSPQSKEELAKMLQEEYNKGREEGERIGYTKGYNKGYKDAEEEYNKAVSYHQ